MLIAIDERTRTADQEAGFVEAEFGEDEAKPFRTAIAEAREELRAAFGVRQKLDDAEPEDPPTRVAMLNEIVERCRRAGAALDRQAARIDELRNLERNAPAILAGLPAQVEAQEGRLPAAETTLADLGRYAEPAWSAVKGNVAEAGKGLAGARAAIERGLAAAGKGDPRTAAREIVTAQDGIAGATALLDAVDKLATAVREDEARLADELRAAATDLADARAAVPAATAARRRRTRQPSRPPRSRCAPRSAAAAAVPLDPRAAYRLAAAARRGSGEVLAAARQDAAQQAQLAAALEASLASARTDVDRAADFIATRRSGVGRQARTRLAEAERLLESAVALRGSDPKAAMDQAREAERRAEEAYSLAAADFDGWNQGGPSPTRRRRLGHRRGDPRRDHRRDPERRRSRRRLGRIALGLVRTARAAVAAGVAVAVATAAAAASAASAAGAAAVIRGEAGGEPGPQLIRALGFDGNDIRRRQAWLSHRSSAGSGSSSGRT